MLIQFTVGNFLSFKDPVTLSMIASSIKEHKDTNLFYVDKKIKLLKSAVIYGANASGKSNFIKALAFFKKFILISSKESQAGEEIRVTNFKLSTETETKPSFFEIIFINDGIRYRYGFEADRTEIHKEWLFYAPKGQEAKLFVREKDKAEIGTYFKEGKSLIEKTRKNALFLSVVAQFNGEISKNILNWFGKLRIISGLNDIGYVDFTINKLKNNDSKIEILKFLKIAGLEFKDIVLEESKVNIENLPKDMPIPDDLKSKILKGELTSIKIYISQEKYDKNQNLISYENIDLDNEESEGTKKFFAMSAPLIDTLKNGYILIIDELDSRLHPKLTQFIIKLFNSTESNSSKAQLLFATHDTNLLNREFFRRDQIWFTEKDKYGATDLYSLVEYKIEKGKKVRKDASYEKDYILGKYGAIPYIGNVKSLTKGGK